MPILQFLENAAKGVVKPFAQVGADVTNTIGNAEVGAAHSLGLAKNVQTQTNQQQFGNTLGNFVGQDTLGQFLPALGQVGLTVAAPGIGDAAASAVGATGAVAKGAIGGASVGGAFNVLGDVGNGDTKGKDLGMAFLQGTAGGAALGATAGAVGSVAKTLFTDKKLTNMAKNENTSQIEKDLTPVTGPVAAQNIAPAIASANDKEVVARIVDNEIKTKLPSPAPMVGNDVTPAPVTQGAEAGQGTAITPLQQGMTPEEVAGKADYSPAGRVVLDNLKSAQEQREALQETYTQQRSQKLGAAFSAGKDTPGLQGHYQELAQLKGELSKPGYLGLSNSMEPEELDKTFAQLRDEVNQKVQGYQRINTNEALRKLVYGDERPPTPGDIKLLRDTFGDEFGDKVQQSVDENANKDSLGDKTFALWRAGLLTGTHILPKVALSHGVQAVGETASDLVGSGIDKFISNFGFSTGERAKTFTMQGLGTGFKEGLGKAGTLLKTGEDSGIGTNSQSDFGNTIKYGDGVPGKVLSAYVNGVGRLHGSIYKPFSEAKFVNSLYDQAKTAATNQGLKGDAADNFVADFVHQPPEDAAMMAEKDAREFSFQQETALGRIATTIQQKGGVLGKALVPFSKIPSAIATDVFNYTPAGAMKTIYDGIKAAKTEEGWNMADQRAFSKGLGRSIVGTSAIIPGIMLYNRGMMTLGYPSDQNEQKLWADEGKTPNSVLIGGKWQSLGSLGPVGSVLSIGAHMADSMLQGKDIGTAMLNGLAGGAQSIQEQSYLQGVNQASTALSDPTRNASTLAKNYAGSIIPAGIGNLAQATDSLNRDTTGNSIAQSAIKAIENRVPGLREQLNPQTDSFGNAETNTKGGLLNALSPTYSSTNAQAGPLLQELRRLQNAGYGEMPATINKTVNFGTSKQPDNVKLTHDQQIALKSMIGQLTENLWAQVIQSPGYQSADDPTRQAALKSAYSQAANIGRQQFEQQYQVGRYSPTLQLDIQNSKQKRLRVGGQ